MNSVTLIGRLTRDVDLRFTQSGKAVGNFNLAVDRNFTSASGEKETDFIDIVAWGKLAENCANHIGKGRLVAVQGRLQIRTYQTNDGSNRKAAEVVASEVKFLDRASSPKQEEIDFPSDDVPF